jgi:hypothetical protein
MLQPIESNVPLSGDDLIEALGSMSLAFHVGCLDRAGIDEKTLYGVRTDAEEQDYRWVRGTAQGLNGILRDYIANEAERANVPWPKLPHQADSCPSGMCASKTWRTLIERLTELWFHYADHSTSQLKEERITIPFRLPRKVLAGLITLFPNDRMEPVESLSTPPSHDVSESIIWSLPTDSYVRVARVLLLQLLTQFDCDQSSTPKP